MPRRTQRLPSNGDGDRKALDYNRLPDPYREWAKIARNFALNVDEPWDKEDLMHIFETESQENILPMPIDVGFS